MAGIVLMCAPALTPSSRENRATPALSGGLDNADEVTFAQDGVQAKHLRVVRLDLGRNPVEDLGVSQQVLSPLGCEGEQEYV